MSKLREAAEKVEMRPGDKLGAITVGLHDDPGIVLLRRIVDSISIVNKMACWDHFAMFELRDYLCERAELAKPDHFPDAGKMVQDGWIPVAERMPDSGCVVLACYRNSAGNLRRIRAEWVAAKTQESDDASDIGEYDEDTDTYYDPQGWYERIDNWDDGFSAVGVSQGEVTHWMHLPDAPGAAAPRPAPAEPQPIAAWSIVRTAESAVVTAVRAALSAAPAPQPAGGERERYEFVLAQCREAQDIAASRGWALNDIATASTTDPKARKIATEALLGAPQVQRAGLTDEQIDRHSIAAVDCPPSSTVILVSSLRRLLGITATKGGR